MVQSTKVASRPMGQWVSSTSRMSALRQVGEPRQVTVLVVMTMAELVASPIGLIWAKVE